MHSRETVSVAYIWSTAANCGNTWHVPLWESPISPLNLAPCLSSPTLPLLVNTLLARIGTAFVVPASPPAQYSPAGSGSLCVFSSLRLTISMLTHQRGAMKSEPGRQRCNKNFLPQQTFLNVSRLFEMLLPTSSLGGFSARTCVNITEIGRMALVRVFMRARARV